ncbi:NepR family anti-sigma factor [Aliiroseovarius sp. YM-037]|uniref:NepR family anti-sigma factor n=1 Tax=Aliiroseovarius sp. YM-037 TaxID=3341728 RepID=UPI003A803655
MKSKKNKEKDKIDQQIDENLRRVFQQKVDEELPDRFKDLIDQLKKQESEK